MTTVRLWSLTKINKRWAWLDTVWVKPAQVVCVGPPAGCWVRLPVLAILGPSSTWASNRSLLPRLNRHLTSAMSGPSSTWVSFASSTLSRRQYQRCRALKHLSVRSRLRQSSGNCKRCFRTQIVIHIWRWIFGAAELPEPRNQSKPPQVSKILQQVPKIKTSFS